MSILRLPAALLAAAGLLAGCGQKGPLYLPDRAGSVVTRPTQTPAAEQPATQQPAQQSQPAPANPADKSKDDKAAPAPSGQR